METLFLSHKDIRDIISKVGLNKVMDDTIIKIEKYFANLNKNYQCLPRTGFLYDKGNVIESMPAREVGNSILFKTVSFHETNPSRGIPTVMSSTILCDEHTGFQKVIADSTLLTCIRTGASTALATKHLAKKDSSIFGFIGAGAQAQACLHGLSRLFRIKKVYVWDKDNLILPEFKRTMEKFIDVDIEFEKPEEFASKADVVTTTTYGNEIVLRSQWIRPGLLINAIGADTIGKQEMDPNILKRAKIVVDYLEQSIKEGELNVPISQKIISPDDIFAELPEIVNKSKRCRTSDSGLILFDSTGDPLEDIAVLHLFLDYNKNYSFGRSENFIFSPRNPKNPYETLL